MTAAAPAPEPIKPAPPKHLEAEASIIGAVLLNNAALPIVAEKLQSSYFFDSRHAVAFSEALCMYDAGIVIDLTTITDALHKKGRLEEAGGAAYLAGLSDNSPRSIPHLLQYVEILRDCAVRRTVLRLIGAIEKGTYGGADLFELNARARELGDIIDQNTQHQQVKVVTASKLLDMKIEPREFLLSGFLTGRSMNEIYSARGVGKTYFALGMAHAIATGSQFLKWKAETARNVLFVDGELDAASLQQRIRALDQGSQYEACKLKLLCCDMQDDPFPNLVTRRAQVMIEDALEDCELLVLDNLAALAPSSNETEAEDWISIQSWLKELKRKGIASIFLHHAGHAGWARGTTRREDLLDLVIELKHPGNYEASQGLRFELRFPKTRGHLGANAQPIEVQLDTDLEGHTVWRFHDLEDVRSKQVIELATAGESIREISKITGIPRSTVQRICRDR